jgi:hypothetical protein
MNRNKKSSGYDCETGWPVYHRFAYLIDYKKKYQKIKSDRCLFA